MTEGLALIGIFPIIALIRVPVAFAIGIATACVMALSIPIDATVATVAQRIATGLDAFALLAIPMFILAGELMNRGGLARRLIDLARALGMGLSQVHVVASMLFGAVSGSAVAAASGVGGVMEARMRDAGHSPGTRAAINVTAATTGLVIPPSNILIVYSLASGGISIAALFVAGYLPGLLMGFTLMVANAWFGRDTTPPRVEESRPGVSRALRDALPSLGIPVAVIGGIVAGVFTATEASAIAVLLSLVLGLAYRELEWAHLPEILRDSAATTGTVMLLIGTSIALSWVLAYLRLPQQVAEELLGFADSPWLLLAMMNGLLLAVGTFMDMTPAVLIFTPILLPAAIELGIDPIHFGIVMVMNLCIGLCTPPVGTVLFVGCGVARAQMREVLQPLLPRYAAMLAALAAVAGWPELALFLPRWFGLLG
jgi:tripartite ATP-independent transporter DctM subunit